MSPAALEWDWCSVALWWVVALLGAAPAVPEVAASWVGACTGVARQDAAGERIPLALPARWSDSALTAVLCATVPGRLPSQPWPGQRQSRAHQASPGEVEEELLWP